MIALTQQSVCTSLPMARPSVHMLLNSPLAAASVAVARVIAKFVTPGEKEPQGFVLTTVLGIIGAFVATYLGQALGWYQAGEKAGFLGAIVGAVIILLIWGFIDRQRRA